MALDIKKFHELVSLLLPAEIYSRESLFNLASVKYDGICRYTKNMLRKGENITKLGYVHGFTMHLSHRFVEFCAYVAEEESPNRYFLTHVRIPADDTDMMKIQYRCACNLAKGPRFCVHAMSVICVCALLRDFPERRPMYLRAGGVAARKIVGPLANEKKPFLSLSSTASMFAWMRSRLPCSKRTDVIVSDMVKEIQDTLPSTPSTTATPLENSELAVSSANDIALAAAEAAATTTSDPSTPSGSTGEKASDETEKISALGTGGGEGVSDKHEEQISSEKASPMDTSEDENEIVYHGWVPHRDGRNKRTTSSWNTAIELLDGTWANLVVYAKCARELQAVTGLPAGSAAAKEAERAATLLHASSVNLPPKYVHAYVQARPFNKTDSKKSGVMFSRVPPRLRVSRKQLQKMAESGDEEAHERLLQVRARDAQAKRRSRAKKRMLGLSPDATAAEKRAAELKLQAEVNADMDLAAANIAAAPADEDAEKKDDNPSKTKDGAPDATVRSDNDGNRNSKASTSVPAAPSKRRRTPR